jgi:hypothetical protein
MALLEVGTGGVDEQVEGACEHKQAERNLQPKPEPDRWPTVSRVGDVTPVTVGVKAGVSVDRLLPASWLRGFDLLPELVKAL